VFLLGMSEGIFPLATAPIEEERRLCFVVLSRGRISCSSPRRVVWQGNRPRSRGSSLRPGCDAAFPIGQPHPVPVGPNGGPVSDTSRTRAGYAQEHPPHASLSTAA